MGLDGFAVEPLPVLMDAHALGEFDAGRADETETSAAIRAIWREAGDLVDPRFIFFAIVGMLGLVVHLAALKLSLAFLPPQPDLFRAAQTRLARRAR